MIQNMQIIKSGIVVAFFTLVSRIFGYIRDILMASYLGLHADAFAVAFRLPNTFRSLFAEGAFSSAFVPMFSSKLATEKRENAIVFANHVFSLLTLILAIFISIMLCFMPSVVEILAPGFVDYPDKLTLTVSLSYFTMPYLFFIALASLYAGVLNSNGHFAVAAALPIVLNLVMILAIIFLTPYSQNPSYALSYGVFIAGVTQLIVMVVAAFYAGLQLKFTRIIIDDDIKQMFKNMIPTIIGSGVVQINILIDTMIASFFEGAASVLYFADRLNQFPLAIIGTALGTVLLPTLSKQVRENNLIAANKTQNKALEVALFFSLPCAFALATISHTLVSFLFERGHFGAEDSIKVARALSALAFGLPAFVMIKIFTPRYFAQYDTKTPVRISFFCILINIVVSLSLIKAISYLGIAIATSVSAWINVYLLQYYQNKREIFILDRKIFKKLIKIILSCSIMVLCLICYENFILKVYQGEYFIYLFVVEILLGVAIYFSLSYYLRILDLSFLIKGKKET